MNAPDILVYDTNSPPPLAKKTQELLHLYNDQNPMLQQSTPEFDMQKPPVDVIEFANKMLHTMNHYGGVGLAAPQCGEPYRIFVMTGGIVCINPVVIDSSKETSHQKEGCLSFPGLILPVTRSVSARFKYTDETGKRIDVTWTGATARVALHEMDHLNGIVFTKRVGTLTLAMAKKKKLKLFKKIQAVVDTKARLQQQKPHLTDRASKMVSLSHQNGPVVTAVQSHREN